MVIVIVIAFVLGVNRPSFTCSDLGNVLGCLAQDLKDVQNTWKVAGPKILKCLSISPGKLFLRNVCNHLHLKLSVYRPGLDHRHTDRQTNREMGNQIHTSPSREREASPWICNEIGAEEMAGRDVDLGAGFY